MEQSPDPVYDPAAEETDFCRSLLSPEDLRQLKEDTARYGYLSIGHVRTIVSHNTPKVESQDIQKIDPVTMKIIDPRINYSIYISGNNIYTHSELLQTFPFESYNTSPEAVFSQQELGVFADTKDPSDKSFKYVARAIGSTDELIVTEDLMRRMTRPGHQNRYRLVRTVKTKIFVGGERWKEFSMLNSVMKGVHNFIAAPAALANGKRQLTLRDTIQALFPAQSFRQLPAPPAALADPDTGPGVKEPAAAARPPRPEENVSADEA